jgi:hypothetical protein
MKAIFNNEWYSSDKVAAQQVDLLGPLPCNWWEAWNERDFFDVNGRRKRAATCGLRWTRLLKTTFNHTDGRFKWVNMGVTKPLTFKLDAANVCIQAGRSTLCRGPEV